MLSDKQKRFCEEYLVDLNATQAAIRAGYSEKTANEQGSQLLVKLSIQEYISELKTIQSERTAVTADRVISELSKIAFVNPKVFYDNNMHIKNIHDLSDEEAASISEIKTKVFKLGDDQGEIQEISYKLHSKISALESLGKHTGIYKKDNEQKPIAPFTLSVEVVPPTSEED